MDTESTTKGVRDALERAISIAGGQTALAKKIGTYQQRVSAWSSRGQPVPPEFAIRIEIVTDGQVRAVDLRPDVFQGVRFELEPGAALWADRSERDMAANPAHT